MKTPVILAAICAAAILSPFAASASTIKGSDSVALFNVTVAPGGVVLDPAGNITSIAYSFGLTSEQGKGDLSVIPILTMISGSTLYPSHANGGAGSTPFTFTITGFGTFTESGMPDVVANGHSGGSSNVSYLLLGQFVPLAGGPLSNYSNSPASLDLGFTKTSGSYSGSGTFAAPPSPVIPEPSSLVLLGTGLLGAVGAIRRRTKI